jgi:DNA-binding transcriptional MerR regulator
MAFTFYASEAARLAGFNGPLMLNHLERTDVFRRELASEAHNGKRRRYTFRDLIILRAINRLLKIGARPKRIVAAIRTFEQLENLPNDADALLEFAKQSAMFVVTPTNVFYCDSTDNLIDLANNGQLAFTFIVDAKACLASVADAASAYAAAVGGQQLPRNSKTLSRVIKDHKIA